MNRLNYLHKHDVHQKKTMSENTLGAEARRLELAIRREVVREPEMKE